MSIVLFHHPFSRAATVLWMLEELGEPYELKYVDFAKGAQKDPDVVKLNPMGKVPLVIDDDAVISESAAIALYLADRYALGRLAPKLEDHQARATYLRWSLFAPSVIEPGAMAKMNDWTFKPSQAGWGTFDEMTAAMDSAIAGKQFVLGDPFSMADCVFGGTIRYLMRFKMIEATPSLKDYATRLADRPAAKRADTLNMEIAKQRGLLG